jgi:predicted amidohydrolase YtcJ
VSTLVLRDAEVDGARMDVRIADDRITSVGSHGGNERRGNEGRGDVEIDCGGGALIPGLHDHHLHLLSMAAAAGSVDVSGDLDGAIRAAHARSLPGVAIRAVHYDEGGDDVGAGPLDRWRLDALAPGRAVRVQHRSGAAWVYSTVALAQVGALDADEAGIERDASAQPTGRLFRLDDWLQPRLPPSDPPDLAAVGRRLASYGVTGVTDCTPTGSRQYFETLAGAVRSGALPVAVWTTGGVELAETDPPPPLRQGPVKIVVADHALPALDELSGWFDRAHRAGRPVAVHCVTRAALLLALAAWQEAGPRPGDRVEHASVTPAEVMADLADLSLTVVTQPGFIAARGDAYLREVDPSDQADLYRCASLLEAGVAVGGSTDAPFGPDDPWLAVRAAVERRSRSGVPVGADRGLDPAAALRLFLGEPERPGGRPRRVAPGVRADLCLLTAPLDVALREPSSGLVALTIAAGARTFER